MGVQPGASDLPIPSEASSGNTGTESKEQMWPGKGNRQSDKEMGRGMQAERKKGEEGTQRQRDRFKDGDKERNTRRDAQKGECVEAERQQKPDTQAVSAGSIQPGRQGPS